MRIPVSGNVFIAMDDVQLSAIRAQGSGGQNVNKVSSAIHLRFDINQSSLPQSVKLKMMALTDHRITQDGVVIIKAQQYRTQEMNKEDALQRLVSIVQKALVVTKKRKATKPTRGSVVRRLDKKKQHSKNKKLRQKVSDY